MHQSLAEKAVRPKVESDYLPNPETAPGKDLLSCPTWQCLPAAVLTPKPTVDSKKFEHD